MGHIIKKILKILLIIVIICGLIFVTYRYKKLKDEGKLEEVFASNGMLDKELDPSTFSDSNSSSNSNKNKSSENDEKSKTDDRQYIVEEKDYEGYYNKFIFDDVILLYEGNQNSTATLELVDRLIKNVDDPMYSKPTIEFKNIMGLSTNKIDQNDFEQYKKVLNEFKNIIGNSKYNISFEYAKFSSMVNKIIIEK